MIYTNYNMKYSCTLFLLFITFSIFGQKHKVDSSLYSYDFLSHDYKYLDDNFNIDISKEEFKKIVEKYNFHEEKIKTCRDSLSVVMMGEFNDWTKARFAHTEVSFTYLRASYYLWISPLEVNDLCENYHFSHPYMLYKYIRYGEDNWDKNMRSFMATLRQKVTDSTGNQNALKLSNKEFLRYALSNNPKRLKDYEAMKSKRAKGDVSCGKKDCCQDKQK